MDDCVEYGMDGQQSMDWEFGFFDSINGDREYSSENFVDYLSGFVTDGVFPDPPHLLQVVATSPASMNVTLRKGKCWIDARWGRLKSDHVFVVPPPDVMLSRIDQVRVQLFEDISIREVRLVYRVGVASASPVPPPADMTATKEMALANIRVNANVQAITQANITDLREKVSFLIEGANIETIEPNAGSVDSKVTSARRLWLMMGGALSTLSTVAKSIVGAINELNSVSVENENGSGTLISVAEKTVKQWFQGIRNNLRWLIDTVNSLSTRVTTERIPINGIIELNRTENPATLLGYGTWVVHGADRVTVCIGTAFPTLNANAGARASRSGATLQTATNTGSTRLTIANLDSFNHNHPTDGRTIFEVAGGHPLGSASPISAWVPRDYPTQNRALGSGTSHLHTISNHQHVEQSIEQLSVTIERWRRTA